MNLRVPSARNVILGNAIRTHFSNLRSIIYVAQLLKCNEFLQITSLQLF